MVPGQLDLRATAWYYYALLEARYGVSTLVGKITKGANLIVLRLIR